VRCQERTAGGGWAFCDPGHVSITVAPKRGSKPLRVENYYANPRAGRFDRRVCGSR
jgi:hypothetical protein